VGSSFYRYYWLDDGFKPEEGLTGLNFRREKTTQNEGFFIRKPPKRALPACSLNRIPWGNAARGRKNLAAGGAEP